MVKLYEDGWLGANGEFYGSADEARDSLAFARLSIQDITALSNAEKRQRSEWLARVARMHPNSAVRRSAMVALREIRSEFLRPISLVILAHESSNQNLRETAIKNLGEIGATADLALLRELATNGDVARFGQLAASQALAKLEQRLGAEAVVNDSHAGDQSKPSEPLFDVALSFAGEDRETAERFAYGLRARSHRVFYDAFYESDLVGEDLSRLLAKIYGQASRFCVVLVSKHYPEKAWPRVELSHIRERSTFTTDSFLIPVRLDDTTVDGVPKTTGHIDLRRKSIEDAIVIISNKIQSERLGGSLRDKLR